MGMLQPAGRIPSPQQVMSKMHLPKNMVRPFQAVLANGLKIMFDAKTHHLMLDELNKPGPMAQKLGEGIAGLVGLLFQQANRSIAPQLLIPVGMVLMAHAADFLNKAGQTVTPEDYGSATEIMMRTLCKAFKVDYDRAVMALAQHATSKGPRK